MMPTELLTIGEVAKMLKKQPYQIVYALSTGKVPEPRVRIGNRRAFERGDVERLFLYFQPKGQCYE